jgi:phosphoribosylformylglycinamidine synthase
LQFEAASPCVFTRGLERLPLPIRHGEGKIFTTDLDLLDTLERARCVACRYVDGKTGIPTMRFPDNPNGSLNAIAGLCDPTGRIFGLMPHPEAYLFPENHPQWPYQKIQGTLPQEGLGLKLFRNAVQYMQHA